MQNKSNKEFSINYRIYYEDTDAGGIVYYANYLKFFERARTELLRSYSIAQSELVKKSGILFVVRKCKIEYKEAAKLDDLVVINTTIDEINAASIKMHQKMLRESDKKLLNILDTEIACIDSKSMKPKRIPVDIINKI